MTDRIEWKKPTAVPPIEASMCLVTVIRLPDYPAMTRDSTTEDIVAALKAAPELVKQEVWEVLAGAGLAAAHRDTRSVLGQLTSESTADAARRVVAERDSALSRSTELQSQRDAIATELRSVAAALGLSTDDTIESLAARCRTAVALGSIGKLRRRAEAAERELAELRKSTESVAEFNAMRDDRDMWMGEAKWYKILGEGAASDCVRVIEERDAAIRDRDNAQSARDVATSELALAKESIRNLEEEIKLGEKYRDLDKRYTFALCESDEEAAERDRLRKELAEAKRRIVSERADANEANTALARVLRENTTLIAECDQLRRELAAAKSILSDYGTRISCTGTGMRDQTGDAPASLPETELAPGSRWANRDGYQVVEDECGGSVAVLVVNLRHVLSVVQNQPPDELQVDSSDVIAVLRRDGLLPDAGVPREKVEDMLRLAIRGGWYSGHYAGQIDMDDAVKNILADYDREKGGK